MKFFDIKRDVERMKRLDELPQGLPNKRNACFLNATLQCLASVHEGLKDFASKSLNEVLTCVNTDHTMSSSMMVHYHQLIEIIATAGLDIKFQHDSHEALLVLLNSVFKSSNSMDPPFVGKSVSLRRCLNCQRNPAPIPQMFSILTLPFSSHSLKGCLTDMSRISMVTGVNCDYCSSQAAISRLRRMNSLSTYLYDMFKSIHDLHLKSLECSDHIQPAEIQKKTTQLIRDKIVSWPDLLIVHFQRSETNGKSTSSISIEEKVSIDDCEYELCSAIIHFGDAASTGHFAAIRRWDESVFGLPVLQRKWIIVSDDKVSRIGSDVFNDDLIKRNVYILVLRKITAKQFLRE